MTDEFLVLFFDKREALNVVGRLDDFCGGSGAHKRFEHTSHVIVLLQIGVAVVRIEIRDKFGQAYLTFRNLQLALFAFADSLSVVDREASLGHLPKSLDLPAKK